MDPSTWMDPYSHLRVPGNGQIGPTSHTHHQFAHNQNLHHMTATTAFNNMGCQKSAAAKSQKEQMSQFHSAMNIPTNHGHGQLMNGHHPYPGPHPTSNGSWFFNSRQQHSNHPHHDPSLQIKNHTENGGNTSFNANAFGLSSRHGVYDHAFMSGSFSQQSKPTNYLTSMAAASDLVSAHLKKTDSNVNLGTGTSYGASSMKAIHMNEVPNQCNGFRDSNIASNSFFPGQHHASLPGSGWHHQWSASTPTNNARQAESLNSVNTPSTNIPRGYSASACSNISGVMNGFSNNGTAKANLNSNNTSNQQEANSHFNGHHQFKNAFPNVPLNSNNSYLNFANNQVNHQNSFVDQSFGAKFAAAHREHYASAYAFAAAAHAIQNPDYAFQQQQQSQKHSQYTNNYTSHNGNCQSSEFTGMATFDSANFPSNRHNGLINAYCPGPLFPMSRTHPQSGCEASVNSSLKSHSFLEEFAHINDLPNQPAVNSAKVTKSRKSQKTSQSVKPVTEVVPPSGSLLQNGALFQNDSFMACNGNSQQMNSNPSCCMANGSSRSASRCSSAASMHQMQSSIPANGSVNSDPAYSYNYSPATTNLSSHSPYQQRSSTSNSSHSSGNSCAMANGGAQDYLTYGTSNSAPSQTTVFPTQTPTPTPGYPTPPSSVGHSNSRCNSNEELSPYSNNSMSSNISQSYSRNDFQAATPSAQISPKQISPENGISDNLQFGSSCMLASQKAAAPSQQHNSPGMFSPNVAINTYKSPQYSSVSYGSSGHLNTSTSSNCSNDTFSSNFSPTDNSSNSHQMTMSQETLMDGTSTYDYGYQQSSDDQFSHTAYQQSEKDELVSTCASQQQQQSSNGHHSLMASHNHVDDGKAVYHHANSDMSSHDNFNLNFDSVIQPIEVNLNEQHVESTVMSETNNDMQLEDELSFIASDTHQSANSHIGKSDNFAIASTEQASDQCDPLDFQSSHGSSSSLIDDSNEIECSNIQSIIDSLPKTPESCVSKDRDGELLANCTNSTESFLSDLAPLMNDNSKIALMESTFKSNTELSTIATQVNESSFDKFTKALFADDIKLESSIKEEEHVVDEFLKNNFNESSSNESFKSDLSQLNDSIFSQVMPTVESHLTVTNNDCKQQLSSKSGSKAGNKSSQSKLTIQQTPSKSKFFKRSCDASSETPSKKKKLNNSNKVTTFLSNGSINEYDFHEINDSKINKSKKKSTSKGTKRANLSKCPPGIVEPIVTFDRVINGLSVSETNVATKAKTCLGQQQANRKSLASKPSLKLKPKNLIESNNEQQVLNSNCLKAPKERKISVESPSSDTKENVNLNSSKLVTSKSSHAKTNNQSMPINNAKPVSKTDKAHGKQTSGTVVKKVDKSVSKCTSSESKKVKPSPVGQTSNSKAKPAVISSKPCLKPAPVSLTSVTAGTVSSGTNNGALLSPTSLINASCLNKCVNSSSIGSSLNNVAPTLIVNQNPSVNPYQVSSMPNAVLISIHPANPAPITSLTAPSTFITLNTPSVTSSTNNTTTTTSSTSHSSSRRRSQDKKVAQLREGLMRTGDFVVAEDEAHLELPVIWRIEGKSLLQRFEASEQNGQTVYINTSSYSAWNPTVRQKYLGLDVRIMGCNRTRIIVEKIGLTRPKSQSELENAALSEKESGSLISDLSPLETIDSHIENFEVYIQTLISQALDPNFIAEIVIEENDEYFMSHMQAIDDLCVKQRERFVAKTKWESNFLKCIETYPLIQIHAEDDAGDLRCRSCHDNWSTKILHFGGEPYNQETLEFLTPSSDTKKTKIASCDVCTDKIFLYSKLYHHRYNFYLSCKSKVDDIQRKDENKASHIILEECLQDIDWIKKLFKELETILISCDNL